jgi:uncharacterized protein YceK
MKVLCLVLVLASFSTGCSSCNSHDEDSPGALENQKPITGKKSIRISPAARKLFDEAGTADAAP